MWAIPGLSVLDTMYDVWLSYLMTGRTEEKKERDPTNAGVLGLMGQMVGRYRGMTPWEGGFIVDRFVNSLAWPVMAGRWRARPRFAAGR